MIIRLYQLINSWTKKGNEAENLQYLLGLENAPKNWIKLFIQQLNFNLYLLSNTILKSQNFWAQKRLVRIWITLEINLLWPSTWFLYKHGILMICKDFFRDFNLKSSTHFINIYHASIPDPD